MDIFNTPYLYAKKFVANTMLDSDIFVFLRYDADRDDKRQTYIVSWPDLVAAVAANIPGAGVTSVTLNGLNPLFTVANTGTVTDPIFTFTAIAQNANLVYAGPAAGAPAIPTFRALTLADMPAGIDAQDLANVLSVGNSTGDQSIVSPNTFVSLNVYDSQASLIFTDGVNTVGQFFADVSLANMTWTDSSVIGDLSIDVNRAYLRHTYIVEFDAPTYKYTQLTADTATYINASNDLVSIPFTANGDVFTLAGGIPTWAPLPGSTLATCLLDFYVTNINSCSPLNILPATADDVLMVNGGGNVGIGTIATTSRLEVVGTTSNSTAHAFKVFDSISNLMFSIRNDGFVGIGATTPIVNALSMFTFKSSYLWAEFMDGTDVTTGLVIRKDTNISTAVSIGTPNGMNNADPSKHAGILFDNANGYMSFGGYPYAGKKFVFNLNYQGNNAQEEFAISCGLHTINTGAYLGFWGAPNSASNTPAQYASIKGYKENATDANSKGYLAFSVNDNISVPEAMRIDSVGNVGIGVTTPTARLHVVGIDATAINYGLKVTDNVSTLNFYVQNDGAVSSRIGYWIGVHKYLHNGGFTLGNLFVGYNAGLLSGAGSGDNVAIGPNAMQNNVNGVQQVAVGSGALAANDSQQMTAIGYRALAVSTGYQNTALGASSGSFLVGGIENTFLGAFVGASAYGEVVVITSGNSNTFIGMQAGSNSATRNHSIALGANAWVSADNQFSIGSSYAFAHPITEMVIGYGPYENSAGVVDLGIFSTVIRSTDVKDLADRNNPFQLIIAGGKGTGTGNGAPIIFRVSPAGASSSSQNPYINLMTLKGNGIINTTRQVGDALLVSGDEYVDTAANILANGDLIVGRKV